MFSFSKGDTNYIGVTQKPKSREVTMYAVSLLKGHQTSQQRGMSYDTSKLDCEKMFGRVGGILKNPMIAATVC